MTDLTLFQQAGVPSIADFKTGVQQARAHAPSLSSGVQYMKMNQFGSPMEGLLTYGAEQNEVQEGSRWAVNTFGIEHGFILRDGGSVNGEAYAPITSPLPSDLRPTRGNEQWRQCYKCNMVCVSGEDLGTIVEYSGDAGGVVKLFKTVLLPAIESQIDVDPEKIFPVLTFEVTSYHSSKQKKDIYEAAGTVVDWVSDAELQELATGEAPEPEPEPEPEAAEEPKRKTTRRRRRAG